MTIPFFSRENLNLEHRSIFTRGPVGRDDAGKPSYFVHTEYIVAQYGVFCNSVVRNYFNKVFYIQDFVICMRNVRLKCITSASGAYVALTG